MSNWRDNAQAAGFLAELGAIDEGVMRELELNPEKLANSRFFFENYKELLLRRISEYAEGWLRHLSPCLVRKLSGPKFHPQIRWTLLRSDHAAFVRALDEEKMWMD